MPVLLLFLGRYIPLSPQDVGSPCRGRVWLSQVQQARILAQDLRIPALACMNAHDLFSALDTKKHIRA
eukprot:scaffold313134_cov16-Tisochrysis_lutea.AAC.2